MKFLSVIKQNTQSITENIMHGLKQLSTSMSSGSNEIELSDCWPEHSADKAIFASDEACDLGHWGKENTV